jgi:hypothetical protein
MSARDNGGSAFPAAASEWIDHPVHGRINRADIGDAPEQGMSLRDWFAGQALAALIAKHPPLAPTTDDGPEFGVPALAARGAYLYADAMLAERQKGGA